MFTKLLNFLLEIGDQLHLIRITLDVASQFLPQFPEDSILQRLDLAHGYNLPLDQ